MEQGFIPRHGGYKNLLSYKKMEIVVFATYFLAKKWVRMGSRTRDQMEQSARSGKQNIVEGSLASGTSKQTEMRLTNVARASIGELQEDFKDFLMLRHLPIWSKDDPRMVSLRSLGGQKTTYEDYKQYVESDDPEIVGNVMICLCAQAGFLLDRQIRELERYFLSDGGIRERMFQARLKACETAKTLEQSEMINVPICPNCEKPMKRRQAKNGSNAGKFFWGCSGYPKCRGIRKIEGE